MDIDIVAEVISELIFTRRFLTMEKIISLNGGKKMSLADICKLLDFSKRKKLKIDFGKSFFWLILDFAFRLFPFFKKFFMRNTFLQQLLPLER